MNLYHKWVHGCEEASYLAVRAKEDKLPFLQLARMRFHLLICSCCSGFMRQSDRIDISLKNYFEQPDIEATVKASETFKSALKEILH